MCSNQSFSPIAVQCCQADHDVISCSSGSTRLYHPGETIGSLALISPLSSCVPPSCAKLFLPGAFCGIIPLVLHEVTQCAFSNLGTAVHVRPEGNHEVPSRLRCTLAASVCPAPVAPGVGGRGAWQGASVAHDTQPHCGERSTPP